MDLRQDLGKKQLREAFKRHGPVPPIVSNDVHVKRRRHDSDFKAR